MSPAECRGTATVRCAHREAFQAVPRKPLLTSRMAEHPQAHQELEPPDSQHSSPKQAHLQTPIFQLNLESLTQTSFF